VEPTTLLPTRMFDHSINLKPNVEPINIKSYHYPPNQKTEIERMVQEMLHQAIIRPNKVLLLHPFACQEKGRIMAFLCGLSPT